MWPFETASSLDKKVNAAWAGHTWVDVSISFSGTSFPEEGNKVYKKLVDFCKQLKQIPVLVYHSQTVVGVNSSTGVPSIFAWNVSVVWPADEDCNNRIIAMVKEVQITARGNVGVHEYKSFEEMSQYIPTKAKVFEIKRLNFSAAPKS